MIDRKRKAFRDADFDSNTKPEDIKYYVGEKFDQAGLPDPYLEDHDQVDQDNDDRDGRGIPANFAVSAKPTTTAVRERKPVESRLQQVNRPEQSK